MSFVRQLPCTSLSLILQHPNPTINSVTNAAKLLSLSLSLISSNQSAMAAYAKSYPSPTTISFFFIFSVSSLLSLASSSDSPTVYEILPKFGLPSGLLPSSVQSYTLDDDGAFAVQLGKPCYIQFDYLVYYDKSISGKLRYGSITELKGIQVQRFFLWLDVDEIKVDLPPSDSIYFQVGFINKKLDIDQFKTLHACRDGLAVSCSNSLKDLFKLPYPVQEEIPLLLTE